MDLLNEQLGDVSLKIEVADGKVKLSSALDSKGLGAQLSVVLEPDYFIDKLAEAVPGKIDDMVLGMLKQVLKGL